MTAAQQLASTRVEDLRQRRRRIDPEIAAKEVLDILIELDGDLVTYRDLARLTDLSRTAVQAGVNYLKDQMLGVEGVSFVSESGKTGGIALTRDPQRAMAFVLLRARIARRQQERLISGTIAPMAQYASGTKMRGRADDLLRNSTRTLEDLQALVAQLEEEGVEAAHVRPLNVATRKIGPA